VRQVFRFPSRDHFAVMAPRQSRCPPAPSNAGSVTRSTRRWWPTPGMPGTPARGAREGNRGTTLSPGRPVRTPHTGSSGKPLPGLPPPYGPAPRQIPPRFSRAEPAGAGLGAPGRFEETPGNRLTATAKRTRYGWRTGRQHGCLRRAGTDLM
jgi:hypothetical protein